MAKIPKLDARRSRLLTSQERQVGDAVLRRQVSERTWYHRMDLGNGIVTPGFTWEDNWNNTRAARERVDYAQKSVLDLGTWDGMWAFEAEALGAALVVATDCMNYWQAPWQQGINTFMLVREALFSKVIPFWNVSMTNFGERLDGLLYSHPLLENGFDVVQHLGILYHLRDPMLSLAQARSVLRDGGTLLLESAVHGTDEACAMHYNAGQTAVYPDYSTWWAPSIPCLREMLRDSLFHVEEEHVLPSREANKPICRMAVRARAVPPRARLGERYLLDPAFGHGFGSELVRRVAYDDPSSPDSLVAYYKKLFPDRELH
jgi:SAM-dependent methyltransferase